MQSNKNGDLLISSTDEEDKLSAHYSWWQKRDQPTHKLNKTHRRQATHVKKMLMLKINLKKEKENLNTLHIWKLIAGG